MNVFSNYSYKPSNNRSYQFKSLNSPQINQSQCAPSQKLRSSQDVLELWGNNKKNGDFAENRVLVEKNPVNPSLLEAVKYGIKILFIHTNVICSLYSCLK
jgi:hypothetical protein